jgi:hypothetical protein
MTAISLPRRQRGRQSGSAESKYLAQRSAFCDLLLQIRSTLDFEISARGWGYILENRGVITKDEIDSCTDLINDCRKAGDLPLDICAVDENRLFDCIERVDVADPEGEARDIVDYTRRAHWNYHPLSFWDYQDHYIQMVVEKIDLKSLFLPICREFYVPIANAKGWADINMRAAMMARFAHWQAKGKTPVLLYCGDFDPAGLRISQSLRSNLADLAGVVAWAPDRLIIDRFGLNHAFIEEQGLAWIENLITGSGRSLDDPRHPDHRKPYVQDYIARYGARKVEANALVVRPQASRDLCRNAILKYIDEDGIPAYAGAIAEKQAVVAAEVTRLLAGAS